MSVKTYLDCGCAINDDGTRIWCPTCMDSSSEKTARDRAVETIEALYPADSEYSDARKIGIELLEQAKRDCNNWRAQPTSVLIRYAQLCVERENEITKHNESKR